jgi:hypothetical protein
LNQKNRFLCPAITSPHWYGLLKDTPVDSTQRKLILVSKILQKLASGTKFGKKELFMMKVNEFIDGNIQKLQAFYDDLVVRMKTKKKKEKNMLFLSKLDC